MNELTREEKNKLLAEFVGYRLEDSGDGGPQWHHPGCTCKSIQPEDECTCLPGCYSWDESDIPDFYADESANALLLEKMREAKVEQHNRECIETRLAKSLVETEESK